MGGSGGKGWVARGFVLAALFTGIAASASGQGPGTSFCAGDGVDPSVTIACPCANTGAAGRGCQNSQGTGGGLLQSSGAVAPDTVVLNASFLVPSSLCIFLQGDALFGGGDPFADGIKCVSGHLLRIGVKSATTGGASYPQAGNVSISQRSAQLGWPIPSGATRWYQVYYRDATTYCVAGNYNWTNGQAIAW